MPRQGLRKRAARGAIINSGFLIGTSAIGLIQAVVVARILPPAVYGLWGLLMAAFITLLLLAAVGVDDKYIQQDDADQQRAFEIAFTFQAVLGAAMALTMAAGIPLFALIYGETEIIGPGLALIASIPAMVLQMPLWVHYRRLDFMKQRKLQLIDPIVTLIATLTLTILGLELWGLVLGAMTGTWAAACVIAWTSPYRLRLRWDGAAAREYQRFSWPLFVGSLSTMLLVQAPATVAARALGVTAVAGIALANNISVFATKVDGIVTQTLYPVICAVKDRPDLLLESFWKSNRLALLWAAPLGSAVALFAGDFVHYVIGEKWSFAAPLIAIYGVIAVVNQFAFNWTAFFRAIGDTLPIAGANLIGLMASLVIAVPLLALSGLTAFGAGLGVATGIGVLVRVRYLKRIFPNLGFTRELARGIAPTIPAVGAVLLLRLLESGPRTTMWVLLEAGMFLGLTIASTLTAERQLVRESIGYLRGGAFAGAPA